MRIGLTQRVLYHRGRAYDATEHGWYQYLKEHTLVPVPNGLDQDFAAWAQELDALIITGGDDSAIRRSTELKLATQFHLLKKPILGVCHGAFLMTEVLGGSVEPVEGHLDTEHSVFYFGEMHSVNSYHNQSIRKLHRSATELVVDSTGNCEAWIDSTIAGVVWHPERQTTPWLPDEIKSLIFKEKS